MYVYILIFSSREFLLIVTSTVGIRKKFSRSIRTTGARLKKPGR